MQNLKNTVKTTSRYYVTFGITPEEENKKTRITGPKKEKNL